MEEFRAPAAGGELVGWVTGDGPRVLALHGGPGMSNYLGGLVDELGPGYRLASYQQRGVLPSIVAGPYDVATAVDDVAAVLDRLDWPTAYLVGHSWGGHLALHVAVALAARVDGVLCLDPLGAVGDGGEKAMGEEFARRVPSDVLAHATELDERAMRGEGTDEDSLEALRLVWPAYAATWDASPAMPEYIRVSAEANGQTFDSIHAELAALEAALPSITLPVGFVAGAGSPIPPAVSIEVAERIPGAWVDVVDNVGHFLWMERPGCIRPALDRLVGG